MEARRASDRAKALLGARMEGSTVIVLESFGKRNCLVPAASLRDHVVWLAWYD